MKSYEQELKILESKMDYRDDFYKILQSYFDKHRHIPKKYMAAWNEYQKDTRPWREIPGIQKKLIKAAKKMARNKRRKHD